MTTLTLPVNNLSVQPLTDCCHKVEVKIETYPDTVFRSMVDAIGLEATEKAFADFISKQKRWNDNLPSFFELEINEDL